MSLKAKIALLCFVLGIPFAAWASPQTAICLTESWIGKRVSESGAFSVAASYEPSRVLNFSNDLERAKARVEHVLWELNATPRILLLDGDPVYGLLSYNRTGSSIALPHKTCLLIGPNGANVDVIAHELVHAELAAQLGYWKYFWTPRWLDEGVAMQVDYRDRYDAPVLNGVVPGYVTAMQGSEFYQGATRQVVQNYAAAKLIVKAWIEKEGVRKLRENLKRDVSGLAARIGR